jgi:predicted MPP superfamily phosphohydrolase
MVRLLVFIAVLLAIDLYAFQAVRFLSRNAGDWQRAWFILYWVVSISCFAIIITAQVSDWHMWPKAFRTYSFALVFIVFISKLLVDVFLLTDDLVRLVRLVWMKWNGAPADAGPVAVARGISRSDFLVKAGMIAGAIPFFSLLYGMISGVNNYRVHRVRLPLRGLPASLDGFRIVQVSDIHTGSFHSREPLERAVDIVNAQKADLVCFTGDLVNNKHEEALPYADILGGMKGKHGVYSILGNHDYGDYTRWNSPEEKAANLENLKGLHARMGWKLLIDAHDYVDTGAGMLGVIGVQNWSGRANFQRYGDLAKAAHGLTPGAVNILLSHDPSHWDAQVRKHRSDIHLTLSGHTHGMQFGVEVPGFKWSPAQYFYREWAGLYKGDGQFLYVNRGLGYIGYPGRVGILPEITVIELATA